MGTVEVFSVLKDKYKIKNRIEILSVNESASINVYCIPSCFVMGIELIGKKVIGDWKLMYCCTKRETPQRLRAVKTCIHIIFFAVFKGQLGLVKEHCIGHQRPSSGLSFPSH